VSLDDSALVRIVLILVAVWLALNVLDELLDILGGFLALVANSLAASLVAVVLILWYLDYI
jgi:hypothetical protein